MLAFSGAILPQMNARGVLLRENSVLFPPLFSPGRTPGAFFQGRIFESAQIKKAVSNETTQIILN